MPIYVKMRPRSFKCFVTRQVNLDCGCSAIVTDARLNDMLPYVSVIDRPKCDLGETLWSDE